MLFHDIERSAVAMAPKSRSEQVYGQRADFDRDDRIASICPFVAVHAKAAFWLQGSSAQHLLALGHRDRPDCTVAVPLDVRFAPFSSKRPRVPAGLLARSLRHPVLPAPFRRERPLLCACGTAYPPVADKRVRSPCKEKLSGMTFALRYRNFGMDFILLHEIPLRWPRNAIPCSRRSKS